MTLRDNFFDSYLAQNPRRTIEHAKAHNLDGEFAHAYCKWEPSDLEYEFESMEWNKKLKDTFERERQGDFSIIYNHIG